MRLLFEVGVVFLQRVVIVTELIEASRFDEHAGVGAGETGDGKEPDDGRSNEDVGVMQRDGNLVEVAVGVATDEKNVEAFFRNQTDAVPTFWQVNSLQ